MNAQKHDQELVAEIDETIESMRKALSESARNSIERTIDTLNVMITTLKKDKEYTKISCDFSVRYDGFFSLVHLKFHEDATSDTEENVLLINGKDDELDNLIDALVKIRDEIGGSEYRIVIQTWSNLETAVEGLINQGWTLSGSPFLYEPSRDGKPPILGQALVKQSTESTNTAATLNLKSTIT